MAVKPVEPYPDITETDIAVHHRVEVLATSWLRRRSHGRRTECGRRPVGFYDGKHDTEYVETVRTESATAVWTWRGITLPGGIESDLVRLVVRRLLGVGVDWREVLVELLPCPLRHVGGAETQNCQDRVEVGQRPGLDLVGLGQCESPGNEDEDQEEPAGPATA